MSIRSICGDPPYPNYNPPPFGPTFDVGPYITQIEHSALVKRVEEIEKRLAILRPNEELQSKYPALQEAYETYKIIEKIVNDSQG